MDTSFLPDGIENKINTAKNIVPYLKYLLKFCKEKLFKGKDDEVLTPKNQKTFEKILPELEKASKDYSSKEGSIMKEFLKDFDIILQNGEYKIIRKSITNKDIIPIIKNFKDQEALQQINVIPYSEAELFDEYKKETKKIPNEILRTDTTKFSNQFKSILALSSHVEFLMPKRKPQALAVKLSLKDRYGEEGLRFCNCYSVGYISIYMNYLKDIPEKEIEEKMWALSKMPIFFVSSPFLFNKDFTSLKEKQIERIYAQITHSMNRNESYVAIHALGGAAPIAEEISNKISEQRIDKNYEDIRIDRNRIRGDKKIKEFSRIWFTSQGRTFCNLFNSLWVTGK